MRAVTCAVLAGAVLTSTGCAWMRGKSGYEVAAEQRSLVIPPDLDAPRADPAMAVPGGSVATAQPTVAASTPAIVASGPFPVADGVESTWRRLGLALERSEGVEIVERAQLLSAYNVRYEGSEFLVRVTADGDGSRVGAVDAKGGNVTGGAAGKLLAALRTRLN